MAVGLIDNDEAEVASATSGTTPSTTASGSNTCAAVGARLSDLSTPTTVKWGGSGGTTMTQVTSPVTVDWWRLVAAATGAGYASWSGNKSAHIVSQTMDNVDQSSPIQDSDHSSVTDTSATNGTDITAAASVTMTSTAGSAALGIAYGAYYNAGSLTGQTLSVSGSLTQRQSYDIGTGKMSFGNYIAAGSSVTVGFTGYGAVTYDDGSYITVDADFVVFKEATGGGGTPYTASLTAASFAMTPATLLRKSGFMGLLSAPAFNLTPQALNVKRGYRANLSAAVFNLTPQALNVLTGYRANLSAPAFNFTGQDITHTTFTGYVAQLTAASFNITPADLTVLRGYVAVLTAAVFSFTGRTLTWLNPAFGAVANFTRPVKRAILRPFTRHLTDRGQDDG